LLKPKATTKFCKICPNTRGNCAPPWPASYSRCPRNWGCFIEYDKRSSTKI